MSTYMYTYTCVHVHMSTIYTFDRCVYINQQMARYR